MCFIKHHDAFLLQLSRYHIGYLEHSHVMSAIFLITWQTWDRLLLSYLNLAAAATQPACNTCSPGVALALCLRQGYCSCCVICHGGCIATGNCQCNESGHIKAAPVKQQCSCSVAHGTSCECKPKLADFLGSCSLIATVDKVTAFVKHPTLNTMPVVCRTTCILMLFCSIDNCGFNTTSIPSAQLPCWF